MNIRADSLSWWKKLGHEQKIYYIQKWQKSLEEGQIGKVWPFVSIDNSSSTIERIYRFHHKITT
jgi:hypothetical protein